MSSEVLKNERVVASKYIKISLNWLATVGREGGAGAALLSRIRPPGARSGAPLKSGAGDVM